MKDFRLKFLLILFLLSTFLMIWTWFQNLNNLDIAQTKNDAYSNELRIEIKKSSDTSYLKRKSLDLIDELDRRRNDGDEMAERILKLTMINILLAGFGIGILIFELKKRKDNS